MFSSDTPVGASPESPTIDVHLLRLPVAIYRRIVEHRDDLLREFRLLRNTDPDALDGLPARFLEMYERLEHESLSFERMAMEAIDAAVTSGTSTLDLAYAVPPATGQMARMLDALHDAAEAQCRAGAALTLPASSLEVQLRRWYLGQFAEQAAGFPPTPWTGPTA